SLLGSSPHVHGSLSSRDEWARDRADGYIPGKPDAWRFFGDSSHEAHKQFDLFRGFAGPSVRVLNAKFLTLSPQLFEWLRQAPAKLPADSGETAPELVLAKRMHQRLVLEQTFGVWAKLLHLEVEVQEQEVQAYQAG